MPNRRMMPTAAAPLLLAGSSSARAAGPRPARTPPGRPANGGARARRCVPPTEQRGALRATRAANGYASRARPAGVFPLPPRGTRAPAPGGAAGEGGTAGGASACRLRRRASAPGAARRRGDPRAGAGASVSPKLVQPGSDRRSSFYAQCVRFEKGPNERRRHRAGSPPLTEGIAAAGGSSHRSVTSTAPAAAPRPPPRPSLLAPVLAVQTRSPVL